MNENIYQTAVFWPVAVPLLVAIFVTLSWSRPVLTRVISGVGLVLMFVAALKLLSIVWFDGVQVLQFGGWKAPFGISFVADQLSAIMVAITGLLALSVGIYSMADVRRRHEKAGFHPLFHGMLAGVNGAFLTGDIFNLYVWFEVMLTTAIGLLILNRSKAQLDGAWKYLSLNLLSTVIFLMGIALLYGAAGTLNMADLSIVLKNASPSISLTVAAAFFLCGFGIKAGFFPMFFWLPGSYHTATISMAAIFAGLLTKVGVYSCFRVFTLLFDVHQHGIREILVIVAACTMLFGVFGAAIQWDIRRILSFHIISQIGYILLGLAIGTPLALAGAIFYVIHHIIVKANLFLLAGAIRKQTGSYDLRKCGGLLKQNPTFAVLFLIPALSLAGLPPLSGFWAKYLIIDATFQSDGAWLGAVALFVGLLTLYSMSKIWIEAFWKSPVLPGSRTRKSPLTMLIPIAMLGAFTVALGLYAEPLVQYSRLAASTLADPQIYITAVFGGKP